MPRSTYLCRLVLLVLLLAPLYSRPCDIAVHCEQVSWVVAREAKVGNKSAGNEETTEPAGANSGPCLWLHRALGRTLLTTRGVLPCVGNGAAGIAGKEVIWTLSPGAPCL